MAFRFDSLARPARASKAVRDAFASCGVDIGLCAAQSITAKAYGYASYHELKQSVGRHPPTPWDANLDDNARHVHHHTAVFQEAGLTHGDAWQVAYSLQLTARRFPFRAQLLVHDRHAARLKSGAQAVGDPLTAMGLTKVQAAQLRAARKEDGGVFLVGGPSWCERDALVETLLREPGPRPVGGYRRRSGRPTTKLDEAFDTAKAGGWHGMAVDFGHSCRGWRDGRLLAAAQGGTQAWLTMHPEHLTTLDRHFQDLLAYNPDPSASEPWKHPTVIGIQSRMACLMGFVPIKRTCPHCRISRDEVVGRDTEKARRLAEMERKTKIELPATVRFANRDGCDRCHRGIAGWGIAASVMVTDARLNGLLLKRDGDTPSYHSREVYDVWRERGNHTMEEVIMANIFAGFVDPLYQDHVVLEDSEPENVRNALAIAHAEGWEVG